MLKRSPSEGRYGYWLKLLIADAKSSSFDTSHEVENPTAHRLIRTEQIRQLYAAMPLAILATVINSLILVLVEWNAIPHNHLLTWFSALLLITLLRGFVTLSYHNSALNVRNNAKWLLRFNLGVVAAALVWAAVPVLIMPEEPANQIFIAFAMAGMAAGGVTTLSFQRLPITLFLGISLIPLAICLFELESTLSISLAAMTLIFMFMGGISSNRLYQTNRKHLMAHLCSLRREAQRNESEDRFQILVENAADAFFLTDPSGKILNVNRAACATLGYSREELLSKNINDFSTHNSSSNNQITEIGEYLCANNRRIAVEVRASTFESKGELLTVRLARDITERLEAERQIEKQAYYDTLTDLPNRRLLLDQLEKELANCKRQQSAGAVFFIDLDQFKTINDSLGHPTGDRLLQKVAERLRGYVRRNDTVARLGGDEFVLILTFGDKEREDAAIASHALAKKIHTLISSPYKIDDHELHISPSIGIALFDGSNNSVHDLIRQADMAMYHAKDRGRNTYSFFSNELQKTVDENLALQNLLRQAINKNELSLYYQPQFDINHKIIGAEALLRWHQEERGFISPVEFIPIAESTGLILPIGDWVLKTACQHVSEWQQQGLPDSFQRVAINISPKQFSQGHFSETIQKLLQETGANPSLLELEITENTLLENTEILIEEMHKLKEMNIHFAIDDFGTGYSSLSYIKNLPLNKLKIDRSFVQEIIIDEDQANIVETIISMAKHLGLKVIAEGVESLEEIEFLKQRDCLEYQGFYFSRPLPHEEFTALLFGTGFNKGKKAKAVYDIDGNLLPSNSAA